MYGTKGKKLSVYRNKQKRLNGNSVHTACEFSLEQQYPYPHDNAQPKYPYCTILLQPICEQRTKN